MTESMMWQIDPGHSSVEFGVKHMMFSSVRGRFKELSGTIEIDESVPDRSSVNVEISAASIDTSSPDRDPHLRSADFLDVERYPTITFRSKRLEEVTKKAGGQFRVIGDLTIRGVSREVILGCTYEGQGKDPWGGERAGFRASARIDRRDWGLTWNQVLETGGILVGNDLRVEIEVEAMKAVPALVG